MGTSRARAKQVPVVGCRSGPILDIVRRVAMLDVEGVKP